MEAILENIEACANGTGLPGCSRSNPAWQPGDRLPLIVYVHENYMVNWTNVAMSVNNIEDILDGNFGGVSIWSELVCTPDSEGE